MADEDNAAAAPKPEENAPGTDAQTAAPVVPPPEAVNRVDLLDKARAFLRSPQVMHEDVLAKRRFLAEKGLNDAEIEQLMVELPPLIPPRTYPPPPPSNLPNLLTGVFRIMSWVTGSSVALVLMYFKFIYPRLHASFEARLALHHHQKELLGRLTRSLEYLKESQKETFAILPQPRPAKEHPQYVICHTLDDILSLAEESHDIPGQSLLRCAIEELGLKNEKATTQAIFLLLESKFPWISSEEEPQNETKLWDILSSTSLFEQQDRDANGVSVWVYHPPPIPSPPPLLDSLSSLRRVLPEPPPAQSVSQKTLQTLSDFTGYIASQTYTMPFHYGANVSLTPKEEEIRREIRALKGLVLNRRSFMPARPSSVGNATP